MYPGAHAAEHPDRACFIMADSGESVTYAEYEARCNRLAHLLRDHGLQRLDHYSIFMENNSRYLETCGAGERSGLYYTCVNSHLTVDELAYILDNSESRVLITSRQKQAIALEALAQCPRVTLCLVVDGTEDVIDASDGQVRDYASQVERFPSTPLDDEQLGTPMLYSSGTTGRPKGILRPLPEVPPGEPLPLFTFLAGLPVARPALSLRTAGGRGPGDPDGWNGDRDGAI
jgi:long-chain acyl-CoA synthetase